MNGHDASYFPKPISISSILEKVHIGQIMLPRFQRRRVWNESTSAMLIESVLNGNPVGLFLTLEVESGRELFVTRRIRSAPEPTRECEELLLDGQQRVISLYRAIKAKFKKPFIVEFKRSEFRQNDDYEVNVHQIKKLKNAEGSEEYDLPEEVTNHFFPARFLSWETKSREAREWIKEHAGKHGLEAEVIEDAYWDIRTKFLGFNIPAIRLPKTTSRERAIDIFIQMNQSVAKLSAFDIAVAQMEEKVEESLHDRVGKIAEKTQLLGQLGDDDAKKERKIGDFALRTFCLRQGKLPTDGNFLKLNFEEINKEWSEFESAIERMNNLLDQEKVWDQKRLPRLVPLHVIVALFMKKTFSPDKEGLYSRVLTKYLWRAFLSGRYSYAANKHMKDDYDKLLCELEGGDLKNLESNVPIFKKSIEVPELKDIQEAGWPSRRPHLGKAILILTLKEGAKDIATESLPRQATINEYEYHHIYPKGYMEDIETPCIDSVINCMLLKGPTNNTVKDKAPSEYLMDRMKKAEDIPISRRQELLAGILGTHIIPINKLLESKPKKDADKKERENNFKEFIGERAEEIKLKIKEIYKLEFAGN